jgi:hypothetical protein
MKVTDEELKAIEDRATKATPGPWYSSSDATPYNPRGGIWSEQGATIKNVPCDESADADFEPRYALTIVIGGCQDEQGGAVGIPNNQDADFIAHARTDIALLLEEIKRLRESRE